MKTEYEEHWNEADLRFNGKKKKKKGTKRIGVVIALIVILLLAFIGRKLLLSRNASDTSDENTPTLSVYDSENIDSTEVEYKVTFLDVGEGAAVLLTAGDTHVLIDGGPRDASGQLTEELKNQNITELDLVIATHYDADHIGGFLSLFKDFTIKEIWGPDYETDTETYREFTERAEKAGLSIVHPEAGSSRSVGSISLTVLGPVLPDGAPKDVSKLTEEEELNENEYSFFIKAVIGGTRILFTGDSDEAAEKRVIDSGADLSCDVYFVSHHGSYSGSSEALLNAMNAKTAVISVGADNDYGHPHEVCLKRLRNAGLTVYRTDRDGTVVLVGEKSGTAFYKE